jgi:hypothetical protein
MTLPRSGRGHHPYGGAAVHADTVPRLPRRALIAALVGLPLAALAAAAAVAWWPGSLPDPLSAPDDPVLPDLALSPLTDFTAGVADDGDLSVRFTASIGNVGEGPFIVHAVRADDRGDWRVSQRFRETEGPTSEVATEGDLTFGGHGHEHWHVQLGASYWLTRPDSSAVLRRYAKVGYCFFDQTRLKSPPPDTPTAPTFGKDGCDGTDALELEMGLSPGWADPYHWTLPDQRLLVNGLADGTYRLWADADPGDLFRELNETNNLTWVDLRLTLSTMPPSVEVVRRGPAGASAWAAG